MGSKNKFGTEALRGRPSKGKNTLTRSINLKLTEDNYKTVKEKARKLGITSTVYAREMTLNGGVKSRFTLEELDLMRKLAGMANNLNQIARKANSDGLPSAAIVAAQLFRQIKTILDDSKKH